MATAAVGERPVAAPRTRGLAGKLAIWALVAVLAYLVVVPLVRLQALAFEDGAAAYRTVYGEEGIGHTIRMTVLLAIGSLVIALVMGTGLAWAAMLLPRRLRLLRVLPILPIVVPGIASVLGWSFLFSPRPGYLNALLRHLPWWNDLTEGPVDIYTMPWIIIVTGLALTAFVYLFASSAFENINGELVDAARMNGGGLFVFRTVILPLIRPALVYGGAIALMIGLGQFTPPLLLGRNAGISVLTTDMYYAAAQEPPDYAAAAAIGSPLLLFGIAIVVVQKLLLGDQSRFVSHGGGKGGMRPAARSSKLAVLAIALYGVVATALPIAALLIVALSGFWSGDIDPSTWKLTTLRSVVEQPVVLDAIRTSVIVASVAVVLSLALGFLTASILLRRRTHRVARQLLDFVVALPLSIPAVIFGVGFLLTYTQKPLVLYGTRWVMILVYVTLMLPFATRMALSGLITLGATYAEASRVSGAGPVRTALQIVLPLLRPTLGGAAALTFVLLANEFAASVLVRSATTQVMGTILFDYYNNGSYPFVASVALVMVAVTTLGVLIAVVIGGPSVFKRL